MRASFLNCNRNVFHGGRAEPVLGYGIPRQFHIPSAEAGKLHRSSPVLLLCIVGSDPRTVRCGSIVCLRLLIVEVVFQGGPGLAVVGGWFGVSPRGFESHKSPRPTGPSSAHPTLAVLSRGWKVLWIPRNVVGCTVLLNLTLQKTHDMVLANGVFNYGGLYQHPPTTLN